MSLYDYEASREIGRIDAPFYALIMAAYRRADSTNTRLIKEAWPWLAAEFEARYHAPGGRLPSDDPALS